MSGSLADRFGKIVHLSSRQGALVDQAGGASAPGQGSRGAAPRRRIRLLNSFDDEYVIGKEVMPSTHSYMEVRFATRKCDGAQAVVKLRFKPKCFRNREDEKSWRFNTEFLLNVPETLGVARLLDVIEDDKAFYVVMERVGGSDLYETLEQEGAVTPAAAQEVLRQLLSSVAFLHRHNAVHKDLKLENVMLDSFNGTKSVPPSAVKVIDFDTLEEWTPAVSRAKDVVGTDQYIAQEAYAGKYSPLSDVFSIGVIAYRLLTGKFPFHDDMFDDEAGENWVGSPKMVQIRKRLKAARVDFSQQVFRDSPQACDLVMRMLASCESHRPSAAVALSHAWLQEDSSGSSSALRSALGPRLEEDLVDDGIIVADH